MACAYIFKRHSFRIVSGESPETMRKLCHSTKFPHQQITEFCPVLPKTICGKIQSVSRKICNILWKENIYNKSPDGISQKMK